MTVVVICGDAGRRGVVLGNVVLLGVAVVRRGEHHGRLVRLRVLMVQVDHAPAAVRRNRHAGEEKEKQKG